ncbi:hypothetical protein [Dyella acidiphila]|uniref:Uncharacterized protein n=1 Tax=Dyella acidiphila TaxID=2775866 RepID=A0ABR9G873_9GAMM|nr:hypothetical protein [Dyella acidiphila]MBE1160247.1 hypothetical protein [Dyella acidiphila]
MNGLLDYSTACLNVRRFVLDESTSPWPLTAAQTDGLQAALHFLDEYTELLGRERDG